MNVKILLIVIVFFSIIVYNIDIVSEERNDKVIYDIKFSNFQMFNITQNGISLDIKSKQGFFGKKYLLKDVSLVKRREKDYEFISSQNMTYTNDIWKFYGKVKYVYKNTDITAYELSYYKKKDIINGKNFIIRDSEKSIIGQSFTYDKKLDILESSFTNIIIKD